MPKTSELNESSHDSLPPHRMTCTMLGTHAQQIPDCHWPTGIGNSRKNIVSKRVESCATPPSRDNSQIRGWKVKQTRKQRAFSQSQRPKANPSRGVPDSLMTGIRAADLYDRKGPDRGEGVGR